LTPVFAVSRAFYLVLFHFVKPPCILQHGIKPGYIILGGLTLFNTFCFWLACSSPALLSLRSFSAPPVELGVYLDTKYTSPSAARMGLFFDITGSVRRPSR
ncbi:MAG: hypothetical protein IJW99_09435, partial [Clostridia bacterium]|nr:hypothetical protein [Clostridia bacterium]